MTERNKKIAGGFVFVSLAALVTVFQNCSAGFSARSYYSLSNNLAFAHPDVALTPSSASAEGRLVLGDRDYIQSVFEDVFSSNNQDATNFLREIMNQEIGSTQVSFGRACDPFAEGILWAGCRSNSTNVTIEMNATSSSIREGARVQTCRRLLNNDVLLGIPIAKVKGNQSTPNATSIDAAVRLFYPARERNDELVSALVDLNSEMIRQDESVRDRWRMIFTTLCESPTWEIL